MNNIETLIAQGYIPGELGTFDGIGGYLPTAGSSSREVVGAPLTNLISNILGFLTIVAGISFLIYFAIGGLTWITSGGDKGKVDEAKSRMTGAAIGMIIIVVSWAITWILGKVLGVDFINFTNNLDLIRPGQT